MLLLQSIKLFVLYHIFIIAILSITTCNRSSIYVGKSVPRWLMGGGVHEYTSLTNILVIHEENDYNSEI